MTQRHSRARRSLHRAASILALGMASATFAQAPEAQGTADASQASGAEVAFLKHAGADDAKADIRDLLRDDETAPVDTSNAKSLLEKVTKAAKDEPVVDAKKEAERLRANKDAGKPVTEGDTPVENKKSSSVLDQIF